MLRFQGVYGMDESEMANGKLHGKQYKWVSIIPWTVLFLNFNLSIAPE